MYMIVHVHMHTTLEGLIFQCADGSVSVHINLFMSEVKLRSLLTHKRNE